MASSLRFGDNFLCTSQLFNAWCLLRESQPRLEYLNSMNYEASHFLHFCSFLLLLPPEVQTRSTSSLRYPQPVFSRSDKPGFKPIPKIRCNYSFGVLNFVYLYEAGIKYTLNWIWTAPNFLINLIFICYLRSHIFETFHILKGFICCIRLRSTFRWQGTNTPILSAFTSGQQPYQHLRVFVTSFTLFVFTQ